MGSITKSSTRKKSKKIQTCIRMGNVGLVQKLEKQLGCELTDIEKIDLWIRARLDEEGQ